MYVCVGCVWSVCVRVCEGMGCVRVWGVSTCVWVVCVHVCVGTHVGGGCGVCVYVVLCGCVGVHVVGVCVHVGYVYVYMGGVCM